MTDQPADSAQPATREPSADTLAELHRLNDVCRAEPGNIDAQIALWQAVARLKMWVCINRGTAEAPRPYMISGERGPILCLFSNGEQATETAHSSGLVPATEPVPLFAVPLPEALDWAMSFGEYGVVGVTIDYPRIGAWSPLPNLAQLK